MTADWTVNSLSEETGLDRRTIKKILADTAPVESDGKTDFYKLSDFIKALIEYHKPKGDASEAALVAARTRLTNADADIREVERARIRNEVMETETVFRVIENRDLAIRRTILTTPDLTDERKDAILRSLQQVTLEDFLEQREFDQGAPAESESDLRAAG
jgi:phage terminase Nu1 subunit (DNA packaging protein)